MLHSLQEQVYRGFTGKMPGQKALFWDAFMPDQMPSFSNKIRAIPRKAS